MNVLFIQACDLIDLNNDDAAFGTLGLFNYQLPQIHNGCVETLEEGGSGVGLVDDRAWKCAQICSLISLACGGILFVFGFFKQCLIPLPCSQLLMDLSSTCVQLSLALVYVIWFSETCRELYDCSYGHGSLYLIICQALWMVAGCFTRCMRPGRSERTKQARREEN
jgi:hypothetical protein